MPKYLLQRNSQIKKNKKRKVSGQLAIFRSLTKTKRKYSTDTKKLNQLVQKLRGMKKLTDKWFLVCAGHTQRSIIFVYDQHHWEGKSIVTVENMTYTESIKAFLKQVISFTNLCIQHFLLKTYYYLFSL